MKMSDKLRTFLTVLFVIYLASLIYGLFFATQFGRTQELEHGVNLVPFAEIFRFWKGPESLANSQFWYNVVGNIAVFVPLGFFTALLLRRRYYGAFALAVTYIVSLLAEVLQYLLKVGTFDIDDVILNTFGGLLGILIAAAIRKKYDVRGRRGR